MSGDVRVHTLRFQIVTVVVVINLKFKSDTLLFNLTTEAETGRERETRDERRETRDEGERGERERRETRERITSTFFRKQQ